MQKEAVVLLNMGGPNSLFEVETFLRNMFNDSAILPIKSKFIRSLVASFIVNRRVEHSKENYKRVGGKSPIVENSFELVKKLQSLDPKRYYTYAMRYTPPYAKSVVEELKQKEIEVVKLFSMYPHHSKTTTLSSIEDFKNALGDYDCEIKTVDSYPLYHQYNRAILQRIKESLGDQNPNDFVLLFSAHGLPVSIIKQGDRYQKEIEDNVEYLKSLLEIEKLNFSDILISYQSKVGPQKWLEPSTIDTIKRVKSKKMIVYPISFTIDNIESVFELDIEYREIAQASNIEEYIVSKCLNSSSLFADAIISMIKEI